MVEMGLDFSPGRRASVWDRDLQTWGNKRGKNVPETRIVCLEFLSWIDSDGFLNLPLQRVIR